jgi:uncharacterized protein (DUF362 family)
MTRRELLRRLALFGAAGYALDRFGGELLAAVTKPVVAVAEKGKPAELVRRAVNGLGGMSRFVKKGAVVVIKPNAGWAREPSVAATTNLEALAEVIRLCRAAGARTVKVVDHPVDGPARQVFDVCGIATAARAAGAVVIPSSEAAQFEPISIPRGRALKSSTVLRDIRSADVFINMPIAKVHSSTILTLSMKNLMGAAWDRGPWHASGLHQSIADYSTAVKPHLVIIDAYTILLSNGPKGPGKTAAPQQVIASTDPVAADSAACRLFGRRGQDIEHLVAANKLGLGEVDLARVTLKHV